MTDIDALTPAALTPAMLRVLRFLADVDKWVMMIEIEQIRLLQDDDYLRVPYLVGRGLLVRHPAIKGAVRITDEGKLAAGVSNVD